MNDLRDKLLLEDGIDPKVVSERELARFRAMLAQGQRRARRLAWLVQIPLWMMAALLLGVCIAEDLWDRLGIPFLAAASVAVLVMWGLLLGPVRWLGRRLGQSRSRIADLKTRLPEHAGARSPGIPLVARTGSTRLVFWPGVLLVAAIVAVIATTVGNGLWLLLTGRFLGLGTAWQILLGHVFLAAMVRHGLTGPLCQLWEITHPNRLLWIAVPRVLTLRVPRAVRVASVTCLLAVLVITAVLSFFQSGTTYARALGALRQARTIHAVGYGFHDGEPVKQSEIWHIRGVGTRIQWQRGDRTIDLYDDGRDRYEYVQDNEYAVKRSDKGELLPRELVEPLRYLKDARRDESQDKTIVGTPYLCYERQDANTVSLMWIDRAMRFRRYEEYRVVGGRRQQVELVEVDYDEPFEMEAPAKSFERRGIRVIEPAQVLETRYGLENAVAATEVLGLTFAVHELHKCGEYLLIACSVRPTAQSLADLREAGREEPVPDYMSLGGFDLSSWWQRNADGSIEQRPYAITELGHLPHKGADIRWYALLARGRWPGQDERLEVCAYVRTDGSLRELRQENGLDWRGQFRPLMTVGLPSAQSDLADLAEDLYRLGHMVTAIGRSAQDLFVSEDSGITQEQFQQRLESLLAGLRPMGEIWDRAGSDLVIRFIDEQGAPVAGVWTGPRVKYADGSIHPSPADGDGAPRISNEAGEIVLPGEHLFGRDSSQDSRCIVYAVHPSRRLVACRTVGGDDFGSPVQIIVRPACLVRIALACPQLRDGAGAVIQADIRTVVQRPYSLNGVILDVVRCSTREQSIQIALPPGEYELHAYATSDGANRNGYRRFTVPANTRTLSLETVELQARP